LVVQRGEGAPRQRAQAGERRQEAQGARRPHPDRLLRGRRPDQARRLQHARRRAPRAPRRLPHRAAPLLLELVARQVAPRFGLSLPNRGVLFGATSVDELLELSEQAEASCAFDSIWVGDSLFAKPRLESLVLLSAIAARTRRVRLGTCCLSTFPLRDPIFLAAQWA